MHIPEVEAPAFHRGCGHSIHSITSFRRQGDEGQGERTGNEEDPLSTGVVSMTHGGFFLGERERAEKRRNEGEKGEREERKGGDSLEGTAPILILVMFYKSSSLKFSHIVSLISTSLYLFWSFLSSIYLLLLI